MDAFKAWFSSLCDNESSNYSVQSATPVSTPPKKEKWNNHKHTLDKNGSLYDPAGTESWNMQIRSEKLKLTMQVRLHGSRGGVFGGHRPPRDPGGPLHCN